MSFGPNAPADKQQSTDKVAVAIKYLRQGWDAQAFTILSEPVYEKNPAAQFALGICHIRVNEHLSAIRCFEQALQLLKSAPVPPPDTLRGTAENSGTYIGLAKRQIEEKAYLTPMDEDLFKSFPKIAEQMILLALIHAYMMGSSTEQDPEKKTKMTEQAKRLSSGLTGPVFEEFKKKLAGNNLN